MLTTSWAWSLRSPSTKAPVYSRLARGNVPSVLTRHKPDYKFQLGKAQMIREGKDVLVIATGFMTMRALDAAEQLARDQVGVAVLPRADDQAPRHRNDTRRIAAGWALGRDRREPHRGGWARRGRSEHPAHQWGDTHLSHDWTTGRIFSRQAPCRPSTTCMACRWTRWSRRSGAGSETCRPALTVQSFNSLWKRNAAWAFSTTGSSSSQGLLRHGDWARPQRGYMPIMAQPSRFSTSTPAQRRRQPPIWGRTMWGSPATSSTRPPAMPL